MGRFAIPGRVDRTQRARNLQMIAQSSQKEIDNLPAHVRETLEAIAELHAEHHRNATFWEKAFEWAAAALAKPFFFIGLTTLSIGWMVYNVILADNAPDHSPFPFLATILALLAVFISLAIVAAQRRASALADLRAQLTLQHTILAETKSAKIIQLLEELRKDDPAIADRPDSLAEAMAVPTDPNIVAAAISQKDEGYRD